MQAFHDRQPVVLERGEFEEWLLAPNERPPLHLMRILPEEKMAIKQLTGLPPDEPQEPSMPGLFD
jgi:putative SOS response-associated peptidase YedK